MALAGAFDKVKQGVGELLDHQAVIEFLDVHPQGAQSPGLPGAAASLAGVGSGAVRAGMASVAGRAAAALRGGVAAPGRAGSAGQNRRKMSVPYNPKSIQFAASTKENTGSEQEGNYRVTTVTATCTITMSVELVFYEAFPADTSVKDQVDLFLELMKRNTGRRIRFSWANMMFEGEAMSLTAAYDMFDAVGNPLSGKVNLSIQGTSGASVLSKAYEQLEQERPEEAEPAEAGEVAGAGGTV